MHSKNELVLPIRVNLKDKGDQVLIVHYYQPNHPSVNVSISFDDNTKGYFHAANCPSISGCRAIVKYDNGEIHNFDSATRITITLSDQNPNADIWLDYMLFAAAASVNPDLLQHAPIDMSTEFLLKCASNHFNVALFESDFCDTSVFSLASKYNEGAKACDCDTEGTVDGSTCALLGGQCECKSNVIGRRCNSCKTGYYGFPECRKCNCPSGNCDNDGKCVCPPNVDEENCQECLPGTYGFDPYYGCEECACDLTGTKNNNTVCDPLTGQCECKENIGGKNCDECLPGYQVFPECHRCDCNHNGTTEQICTPNPSENVSPGK